jgi:phage shock protein PspC (stress-responsive transcriptional regulator)
MQLTQKQESLISQYLRDASRRLDARLPDKVRERSLRQIQTRIYQELEACQHSPISDEDVVAVLRRSAGEAANPVRPEAALRPETGARSVPATPHVVEVEAIWLGVCAVNAERFGIEPWMLRLAAVVLGLLTGPIALIAYLAGYAEYYVNLPAEERPPIDYLTLASRSGLPLLVLLLLRWGAGKVEALMAYAHERLLNTPLPPLGEWDWLAYYESSFFYLALFSVVPLGILSGLPMANAWGHSLKRLAQALVALYAVLLSFGLASVVVGIILDRVEEYLQ